MRASAFMAGLAGVLLGCELAVAADVPASRLDDSRIVFAVSVDNSIGTPPTAKLCSALDPYVGDADGADLGCSASFATPNAAGEFEVAGVGKFVIRNAPQTVRRVALVVVSFANLAPPTIQSRIRFSAFSGATPPQVAESPDRVTFTVPEPPPPLPSIPRAIEILIEEQEAAIDENEASKVAAAHEEAQILRAGLVRAKERIVLELAGN